MGNNALNANPPNANIDITTHTSDWLWAVFAVMALADLIMIAWSFSRPRGTRAFHYIAIAILTIAAIDYFAMASDLGSTPITTEFRQGGTRAIWYSRYIDYALTMPLLLTFLLLSSAVSLSEMFMAIFAALVMVVCFLIGALVHSSYKWGFFTFGVVALLFIWYLILVPSAGSAGFLGGPVGRGFRRHSIGLLSIWLLYPICWGLSEGGNVIKPTGEMVFYGILDLITKPLFLFLYVRQVSLTDYGTWGFHSGKASQFGASRGLFAGENKGYNGGTGTVASGPTTTNNHAATTNMAQV